MKEAIEKIEHTMNVQCSIMQKADFIGRLCAFSDIDIYGAKQRRYSRHVFDEYYLEASNKIEMLKYVKNILTKNISQ